MKTTSSMLKEMLANYEKRLLEIKKVCEPDERHQTLSIEVKYLEQEIRNIKRFLARKEGSLAFN